METWCESCEEVRIYPHDCPHENKTRKAVKRKPVENKVPLWLAFLIIAGSGIVTVLTVRFAAWLGSR